MFGSNTGILVCISLRQSPSAKASLMPDLNTYRPAAPYLICYANFCTTINKLNIKTHKNAFIIEKLFLAENHDVITHKKAIYNTRFSDHVREKPHKYA